MKIDGKLVTRVRRMTWDPRDASEMRGAQIIGRCNVELADGTHVVAPLLATVREPLGERFALLFDQESRTFLALAMDRPEAS